MKTFAVAGRKFHLIFIISTAILLAALSGCDSSPPAAAPAQRTPSAAAPADVAVSIAPFDRFPDTTLHGFHLRFSQPVVHRGGGRNETPPLSIRPPVAGTFRWSSDSEIYFAPKDPLPAGAQLEVDLTELAAAKNLALNPPIIALSMPEPQLAITQCQMRQISSDPVVRRFDVAIYLNHALEGYWSDRERERVEQTAKTLISARRAFRDSEAEVVPLQLRVVDGSLLLEISGTEMLRPGRDGTMTFTLEPGLIAAGGKPFNGASCSVEIHDRDWRTELKADIADSTARSVPAKAVPVAFFAPSSKGREALTVRFVDPAHRDQTVDHKRVAGEILETGMSLEPAIAGSWKAGAGAELIFEPNNEWQPGQHYRITVDPAQFPELALAAPTVEAVAYPLIAQLSYLDSGTVPRDKTRRVVSAAIDFNYPVDAEALTPAITVNVAEKARPESATADRFSVERAPDDPTRVFVRTTPLELKEYPTIVEVRLHGSIGSVLGGEPAEIAIERSYELPSRRDVFVVRDAQLDVAKSASEELQRILTLTASEDVEEAQLSGALTALLLPDCKQEANRKLCNSQDSFYDPLQVTGEVEARSEPVALTFASRSDDGAEETFSYSFHAQGGRQLLVQVAAGLTSKLGFGLDKPYRAVVHLKEYPKRLNIMLDGMLLSLSGSRRLAVLAQNVSKIAYRLSRVRPTDLHHLIHVTAGAIKQPYLTTSFTYDDMAQPFTFTEELPAGSSGKPTYTSIDFSRFMDTSGALPRGLFHLELDDAAELEKREREGDSDSSYRCYEDECYSGAEESLAHDSRLILLTDLGLVVKRALAGDDRVYVASFRAGEPVEGAEVRLVSRNGATLFTAKTDAEGAVSFPDASSFRREKEPVLYVAEKDGDLTFLPYQRRDRELDFSRFDIGGVVNVEDPDALRGMVFTDRGIYRPGESAHFALTVRNRDFSPLATELPLVFRLLDPRGQPVLRETVRIPAVGVGELTYTAGEAALTGTYTAELIIPARGDIPDRILSAAELRVEEFEPDRLRISATLGAQAAAAFQALSGLSAKVRLNNLFGAPAAGNNVKASLSIEPWAGVLPGYAGFNFRPLENQRRSRTILDLGEQNTGETGEAEFAIVIPDVSGAVLETVFAAEGFEKESGRSVAAMARGLVTDLSFLVGVKSNEDLGYTDKGALRRLELVAVDLQGAKVDANGLQLRVEREEWKNVLVKQPNGVFKYESARKLVPVSSTAIDLPAAGHSVALDTATPGSFLVSVSSTGGILLNQIRYVVVGEANEAIRINRNANLELTLDRDSYHPEQTVEISVKAPYPGFGVITVERERVLATKWFRIDTTSSVQRIALPKEVIGNAYVTVLLARAWDSTDIYSPPLSYASVPVKIADANYFEPPQLTVPEQIKPGEVLRIGYQVAEPGALLLYAVDEGILQFGRYKNPEPLKALLPKRALEVLTRTALDLVMPDYAIVQSLLSPGGDEDVDLAKFQNPFKKKTRPPLAYWSGILAVQPGRGEVSFPVPDYFDGAAKVFAYFVGAQRVGFAERRAEIRGDFVIKMNLPTFAVPGDRFDLSAEITNATAEDHDITITMAAEGFEITGESSAAMTLKPGLGQVAKFTLKTGDQLGEGTVRITASGDSVSRSSSEGVGIRPAAPLMRTLRFGVYDPEKPGDIPEKQVSPLRQMYSELRSSQASISRSPALMIDSLNQFMRRYPYDCSEQVASKAFTALMLLPFAHDDDHRAALRTDIQAAIQSIATRMNADGSIAYWQRGEPGDRFVSAYSAHLLIDAAEAGLVPPAWFSERIGTYLTGLSRENAFELGPMFAQAYALYLRARGGEVVTSELTSLTGRLDAVNDRGWQGSALSWLIGATYQLLQMPDDAQKWTRPTTETRLSGLPAPLASHAFNAGMTQYLKARHFNAPLNKDTAFALLNQLSSGMPDSLSAGSLALGLAMPPGEQPEAEALAIATEQAPLELRGTYVRRADVPEGAAQATFTGPPGRELYYSVVESGFDRAPARQGSRTQGIAVARDVVDQDGKAVAAMRLGETYRVIVRLQSDQEVSDFAVQDLMPTGFEPDLEALEQRRSSGGEPDAWHCDHVDVRDDRLLLFGDLPAGMTKVFSYPVKPTVRGAFVWPGIYGEAMYDSRLFAWEAAAAIRVE